MITSEFFDKIDYHYMGLNSPGTEITLLTGFDTEADDTGRPFLFCFGTGEYFSFCDIITKIWNSQFINKHYCVWNLKYDSGAILYHLPEGSVQTDPDGNVISYEPGKIELWTKNFTHYTFISDYAEITVRLDYIPHKYLKISKGRDYIIFWDICQFYQSSLDNAAEKYLGENKIKIETKTFTDRYIKKNIKKIIAYCLRDSLLTSRLGMYFLGKLSEFGIRATALYSPASLSFRYFQDQGEIIDVKRYWKYHPDLLKFAMDAYEGGKFEITSRGSFSGFEYDIVSAYPYEIANLADIDLARVVVSKKFQKNAHYGFIRCKCEIYGDCFPPCGLLIDNTRVYAIGSYFICITLAEYNYLIEIGAKITIINAYWLIIKHIRYPYRKTINKLFKLKSEYKNNDLMLYQLSKLMMNSFYGKMAQMIEDWQGNIKAGISWNPIYAAIITANVRVKVSRIQNRLKNKCLAVHTDSVVVTEPFETDMDHDGKLGNFELVKDAQGAGILIACGCYQIGECTGFKGFDPRVNPYCANCVDFNHHSCRGHFDDWRAILTRYKKLYKIPYSVLRVESWIEAVSKGHFDRVNLFQTMPKNIDLNADIKRVWNNPKMNAGNFLKKLVHSEPRIVVMTKKPAYWK